MCVLIMVLGFCFRDQFSSNSAIIRWFAINTCCTLWLATFVEVKVDMVTSIFLWRWSKNVCCNFKKNFHMANILATSAQRWFSSLCRTPMFIPKRNKYSAKSYGAQPSVWLPNACSCYEYLCQLLLLYDAVGSSPNGCNDKTNCQCMIWRV